MYFNLKIQTIYRTVMVNEERKAWECCFDTSKRKAKRKACQMREYYTKENGWEVSVQKRTLLKVNNWEKEWASEFYYAPNEWEDKWISNPSIDFIRRHMKFIPFGL